MDRSKGKAFGQNLGANLVENKLIKRCKDGEKKQEKDTSFDPVESLLVICESISLLPRHKRRRVIFFAGKHFLPEIPALPPNF